MSTTVLVTLLPADSTEISGRGGIRRMADTASGSKSWTICILSPTSTGSVTGSSMGVSSTAS